MQLYHLTQPRDILVRFVASKIKQQISESQLSVFDYLCSNYFVIIDADIPELIFNDSQLGVVIVLSSDDEYSVLLALAKLKLFHYMINAPYGSDENRYMQQEEMLFVKYFREQNIA